MFKVNLAVAKKVGKVAIKYAGPIAAGAMTVMSEIEMQNLKGTVKELTAKVAKLEKR